ASAAETCGPIKIPVASLHQAALRETASTGAGGRIGKIHQRGYYPVGRHFKHGAVPKDVGGVCVGGSVKIAVAALHQATSRSAASTVTGQGTGKVHQRGHQSVRRHFKHRPET